MWQSGQAKRSKDKLGRSDHCTHLSLPLPPLLSHVTLREANQTSWLRTCTSPKLPHAPPNLGTSPHNASRSPPLLRILDYGLRTYSVPSRPIPFLPLLHKEPTRKQPPQIHQLASHPSAHTKTTSPPTHPTATPSTPQHGPLHPLHDCPRRLLARNRHHARQSLCAEIQGQAVESPGR